MKNRTNRRVGIAILSLLIIAGSVGAYMWFKPHRNVQTTKVFAELKVSDLINEFTIDTTKANEKYLMSDGNSKVLIIVGRVSKINTNKNGEKVIILKEEGAKAGVSATFIKSASPHVEILKVGDFIKVKGSITAGNSYDADVDLYEHATLVQCDIIK